MEYVLTDIHFHTRSSYDAYENSNKGYFDIDLFIENERISERKLGLLVKTDHNILDYNYYVELKNKISQNNIDLILLPGIEINSSESVHWIFVFDDLRLAEKKDSARIGDILDDEIGKIFGYSRTIPDKNEMERAQVNKVDISQFISALNNLGISFLAIPHLNKTSGLYNVLKKNNELLKDVENFLDDNVICGFESKNYNEFLVNNIKETEKKIETLKKELDKSENESTEMIDRREAHVDLMKKLKMSIDRNYVASIYGSDFHGDKDLGMRKYEKLKDNLFYMKSIPSFEGLRFALLDAESRIFNSDRINKFKKSKNKYISKIFIKENGHDMVLNLGDGLNTIIGSRGSGKSYLVKSLIGENANYNESSIKSQIQVSKIVFGDESVCDKLDSSLFDILNQKGKSEENHLNIYEIMAEAPYNTNKFVESIKKHSGKLPIKQEKIKEFVCLFNRYLDCLKNERNLAIRNVQLNFLQEYNKYTENHSDILSLGDKFTRLKDFIEKAIDSKGITLKQLEESKEYANKLNENLSQIKGSYEYKTYIKNDKDADSIDGLIFKLNEYLEDTYVKLESACSSNRNRLNGIIGHVLRIINRINQDLTNEEKGYSEKFNLLQKDIHEAIIHLKNKSAIKNELGNQFKNDIYDEELINFSINGIDYIIRSQSKFNLLNLSEEQSNSFFDNYKNIPSKKMLEELVLEGTNQQIEEYFNSVDARKKDYHVKLPTSSPKVLVKNVTEQTDYQDIVAMSPGQRSNLLLDMILQNSTDKILILDQPEDDLDNETIYKSITKKLRSLKLRRQLLVITHNANIAVNGDSDYLVVCQNKEGVFSCWSDRMESLEKYNFHSINSSIQNVRQLEIATTILDGGKEAIRRRVKSIGYKDLFLKGN